MTEETTVQEGDTATEIAENADSVTAREYIGVKLIAAVPMTRGEYNAHRGWEPPEGEDQSVEGYHVTYYPDGYESWSPKDVFEEAYVEVAPGLNGPELLETVRSKIGFLNVSAS